MEVKLDFGFNFRSISNATEPKTHMRWSRGGPLINYDVPFGLGSIPLASQSMTEQFVGGARVSIIPTSIGTAFIVNNSTEWYSFSYHLGDDTNRIPNQITPNGTIYQRFMWIQK